MGHYTFVKGLENAGNRASSQVNKSWQIGKFKFVVNALWFLTMTCINFSILNCNLMIVKNNE